MVDILVTEYCGHLESSKIILNYILGHEPIFKILRPHI